MPSPPEAASAVVAPSAVLGPGVSVGEYVVVHEGTRVGDNCALQDGVVLGKPAVLGPRSTAAAYDGPPAALGEGVTVCSQAVVFAGATIGAGTVIGDGAVIRENVTIGAGSVIGAKVVVEHNVSIGSGVKIQTGAYITAQCTIEDDVFVAPRVVTTNDNTAGRHGPGTLNPGATLRRACRIGAAAVLLPGIEVGEDAFVAAGAVVTRDVEPYALVMGSPAKFIRRIDSAEEIENWR